VVAGAAGYFAADRFWISKHAFAPPPHSIAVLPFVNLGGNKDQEYFSDGLTEELLNSLAQINDLQVAARTSSFSFREHADIVTVAHKLNVATVLEGSVRRSAQTMRVTAQLINAVTGFHLWSKTYDRDIGDVLNLQTEIATAVAEALKVTLLGDVSQKIELGGTRNPAAFDAYLHATRTSANYSGGQDVQAAIAQYTEAISLDPDYARALAGRAIVLSRYAGEFAKDDAIREYFDKAEADARQAIALAPGLAEGYLALAVVFEDRLDFTHAAEQYERAVALAPGNARVIGDYGLFLVVMGRFDQGLAAARRAVVLDPLNPGSHDRLGLSLLFTRRYDEAIAAYQEVVSLDPDSSRGYTILGLAHYVRGNLESARSSCELKPNYWERPVCLALAYERLGRHADAQVQLAKLKASEGDGAAYQYAQIYAQWGNHAGALEALDTALRLRDGGLEQLRVDPLLDPLRTESRFEGIVRELKFPPD
jgi:TolB-like protein